jgi:uncharacterized repeat protein (TIGR01451 family)
MRSYLFTRSPLGPVLRLTFISLVIVAQALSLMPVGVARAVAPTSPPGCTAATTTFTNNIPQAIGPNISTVSSNITVAGAGTYLWDVDLTTAITHTANDDLNITLRSPAGTVVTLTTDNGGNLDNVFNGTLWDDDANPAGQVPYATNNGLATDHNYVNNTTATPLVPEEAMAAFVGENPNGIWTLTISDDANGNGGTLNSWSLTLTTFTVTPVTATTTFTNNTPVAISGGMPAVVTSTIAVAGTVNLISDVNVTTAITHTANRDLDITLRSPAGTVVTLTTDNGGNLDNVFNGTLWDDDANPAGQVPYATNNGLATDHNYINNTTATPLVPEEALGAFMGESANGTWTLSISDDAFGNGGTLNSWSVQITTASCPIDADLSITKTDGQASAVPGQPITYTITAGNAGPSAVTGATLADTFPASLTGVAWTCAGAGGGTCPASGSGNINASVNLPVGGSVTFTVNATIDPAASGTLTNTATITAPAGVTDPDPTNNSATDSDTLTPQADLSITKSDDADPVVAGTLLTYTVVVVNQGPSIASGVQVTDTLPAGVSFVSSTAPGGCTGAGVLLCDVGTVQPGLANSVSFTITVLVGQGAPPAGTTISNSAAVSATTPDPDLTFNTATETTQVVSESSLVTLKVDSDDPVLAGTSLSYTITVQNTGPSDAHNIVATDVLPAGVTYASDSFGCNTAALPTLTCNIGTLPVSGIQTITLNVLVDSSTLGTITNTVTVTGAPSLIGTLVSSQDTLVLANADLAVSKQILSGSPFLPGSTVTYRVTVTNNGPSDAAGFTLSDVLPAGLTYVSHTASAGSYSNASGDWVVGTLASGDSVTLDLSAAINSGTANTTITNTAAITSTSTPDPDVSNNTASANFTVGQSQQPGQGTGTTPGGPSVFDPAISKRGAPTAVAIGETVVWTIEVSNPYGSPINFVLVNDPIPAQFDIVGVTTTQGTPSVNGQVVTVDIGTLAPGQTVTIQIETVGNQSALPGQVCNTARAGAASSSPACITLFPSALPPTGGRPLRPLTPLIAVAAMLGLGSLVGGAYLLKRRMA